MTVVSEKIKQFRLAKGWTQQELADKTGYSNKQTISKWETGTTTPKLETAVLLSELFEVTLDCLVWKEVI